MNHVHEKFATALNCMDGRAIRAVMEYFEKEFNIPFVDMPTAPGMDKVCALPLAEDLAMLQKRVIDISVGHHGSRTVAVVGHAQCAGNPVDDATHEANIKAGVDLVASWNFKTDDPVRVFGLWVAPVEGSWKVAEILADVTVQPLPQTEEQEVV